MQSIRLIWIKNRMNLWSAANFLFVNFFIYSIYLICTLINSFVKMLKIMKNCYFWSVGWVLMFLLFLPMKFYKKNIWIQYRSGAKYHSANKFLPCLEISANQQFLFMSSGSLDKVLMQFLSKYRPINLNELWNHISLIKKLTISFIGWIVFEKWLRANPTDDLFKNKIK